jgi:hypothetical protein
MSVQVLNPSSKPESVSQGNLEFVFTATVGGGLPDEDIAASFQLDGTAVFGTDYMLATTGFFIDVGFRSAQFTYPSGVSSLKLGWAPINNNVIEEDKTIVVSLAPRGNYNIDTARASAVATIVNDDFPVLTVPVAPAAIFEDTPASISYTFTLSTVTWGWHHCKWWCLRVARRRERTARGAARESGLQRSACRLSNVCNCSWSFQPFSAPPTVLVLPRPPCRAPAHPEPPSLGHLCSLCHGTPWSHSL